MKYIQYEVWKRYVGDYGVERYVKCQWFTNKLFAIEWLNHYREADQTPGTRWEMITNNKPNWII